MRKITILKTTLVAIIIVVGSINAFAQVTIAGWDFSTLVGSSGVYGASPLSTSSKDANVTVGGLTRGSGFGTLAGTGASAAWGSTNFSVSGTLQGEIDANKYFTFTITANVGYKVSLSGISAYNIRRSSTGPTTGQWQYQIGSGSFVNIGSEITWGATTSSSGNAQPAIDLSGITDLQNVLETSTITIRLVCYGASAVGGTNYLKDLGNTTTNDLVVLGTTASTSGPATAVTPSFSVVEGKYVTSQNVELSTLTDGASIYYTTNNTNPTDASTLYTGTPLPISATTTVKAVAYKTGMNPSGIATSIYTFPTSVANLAALRVADVNGFYKITGEVLAVFKSVAGKSAYIQDATAGILVYDAVGKITTPYNFGDGITNLNCTLLMYSNGTLELIPFNDPGVASSTGNTLTPKVITIAQLNSGNYQGQYVKINSISITGTGIFVSGTSYAISDGVTTGKMKVAYSDLDYIGKNIPGAAQDITGVVYNSTPTEVDLVPRFTSDFSAGLTTGVDKTTSSAKIYTSNGNIILSASANQTIEIYNTVGQKLLSRQTIDGLNTIPVSAHGVIIVKLGNKVGKVIL